MNDLEIGIKIERTGEDRRVKGPVEHRRKWKRFIVQTGPIVILHVPRLLGLAGEKTVELGPVINISEGGLMVQFIENKERLRDCGVLSIQVPGLGIKAGRISFEVVRDFEVGKLPDGRKIRNRSIKFSSLTPPQLVQVKEFIRAFSSDFQKDRRSGKERRARMDPDFFDSEWKLKSDRRRGHDRRQYPAVTKLKTQNS
ncbi:MAG: hypothetical protein ACOZF0_14725 [Thermodesulfobacteriota bacterium]